MKYMRLNVGRKAIPDRWHDDAPQNGNASDQQINPEQNAKRHRKIEKHGSRSV
jgi:hypothetical protein